MNYYLLHINCLDHTYIPEI